MHTDKMIRAARGGVMVLSAAFCGLGLFMIVRPALSVILIARAIGAMLIALGAMRLAGYFSRDLYQLAFQFDLAYGVLLVALGALVLLRPDVAATLLVVVMGVETVADGLFRLQTSLDARRFGLEKWWLILLLAVAAAALGGFMIFSPLASLTAINRLLGAAMLLEGALNLCVALCAIGPGLRGRDDAHAGSEG